jgi:hypothetical protein
MSTFFGKYRGVVVSNRDPMVQGRIQVRVPEVADTSGWAVPCLPAGGPPQAQFEPPSIGSGVWVEFEGGDPAYPIWAGNLWDEREARFPGVMVEELPGPVPTPGVPTSERLTPSRPEIDRPNRGFPLKIEAPDLKADANEVRIEPIELPKQDEDGPPDD